MKAMRLHEVNKFTLDEINTPTPKGNEILIKVDACGICGSDIPRVYELGTRVYPVTLGHEFSGTVVAVGNEADKELIGKSGAVFPVIPCRECNSCKIGNYALCTNYDYLGSRSDGGFAKYCLIPSKWHLVMPKGQIAAKEDLSLVEPATVAQHALRRGGVDAGSTVLILGAGPIGILTARWAKLFGAAKIILVDIDEQKVEFARKRELHVINSVTTDLESQIAEITGKRGVDIAIEGTGSSAGINSAIACVRPQGKIVLLGNPHQDTTIKLAYHSEVLRKELALYGVWNSYYHDVPINEWQYTVDMIEEGQLKVNDLITNRSDLNGLKDLFDQIYHKEIVICKAIYSAN